MSADSQGAAGLPYIVTPIHWRDPLHPGDNILAPDMLITNGPIIAISFTDEQGNPIQTASGAPRCAMEASQEQLPPCSLALQLSPDKTSFHFAGAIARDTVPGTYTFYIQAQNAAGKGNVATCIFPITPKS